MSVIFGKWMNTLPTVGAAVGLGAFCSIVGGFWYWATPKYWQVGYMPQQPGTAAGVVGFSHQIHAGKLGFDCRYCHTKIEKSGEANIPNVATCYGCHAPNHVDAAVVPDDKVKFIRAAFDSDQSIAWRRVHKLPDYVRNFPHDAHIKAGVSCFSCHGQMTALPVVLQEQPLSMGWCLDCHRDVPVNPQNTLVPPDQVTQLVKVEQHLESVQAGRSGEFPAFDPRQLLDAQKLNPPTNCGACHY